jgi:hypothetical protein
MLDSFDNVTSGFRIHINASGAPPQFEQYAT